MDAFLSSEISDFQADNAFQGFNYYGNGRLIVQECGLYYIYAQAFFVDSSVPGSHNRVALSVNGAPFSLLQSGVEKEDDYGSFFTAGVALLNEGDYISLITAYDSKLWVAPAHTFFGAYKIGASANYCPPAENCVKS